jgi:hypothetical protein
MRKRMKSAGRPQQAADADDELLVSHEVVIGIADQRRARVLWDQVEQHQTREQTEDRAQEAADQDAQHDLRHARFPSKIRADSAAANTIAYYLAP